MAKFYLFLTLVGIALPYAALLPWLFIHGVDIFRLFEDAIVNPISIFAWLDVFVSAIALLGFIMVDGKRNNIRYHYLAVIGTLSVGVSCGLPFYLYLKEKQSL
ncbi:DUF2834 domain-containing protein [Vibrio amylolyticus]|uniref:DUF2834 domain-containing protein n=1 Tax=Vibrio amylolyticus TaxID=2847292 RepID=UPI00354F6869